MLLFLILADLQSLAKVFKPLKPFLHVTSHSTALKWKNYETLIFLYKYVKKQFVSTFTPLFSTTK